MRSHGLIPCPATLVKLAIADTALSELQIVCPSVRSSLTDPSSGDEILVAPGHSSREHTGEGVPLEVFELQRNQTPVGRLHREAARARERLVVPQVVGCALPALLLSGWRRSLFLRSSRIQPGRSMQVRRLAATCPRSRCIHRSTLPRLSRCQSCAILACNGGNGGRRPALNFPDFPALVCITGCRHQCA